MLALGMFALGTDNFVVAGILPSVAKSLDTTASLAGQMVTVYALSYAVMAPVMMPRRRGWPRPVSWPSSDKASANPIETPAPTEAAMPTRNVSQVLCVAKAAANSGASVDTEPSMRPARPGCTICSTNMRRRVSSSAATAPGVRNSLPSCWARLTCERSAAARSPSSLRMLASVADLGDVEGHLEQPDLLVVDLWVDLLLDVLFEDVNDGEPQLDSCQ